MPQTNVNHPLIHAFQAIDLVPHLHGFFGDRGGAECWARLSETCYTFSSVAWISSNTARLRSRGS